MAKKVKEQGRDESRASNDMNESTGMYTDHYSYIVNVKMSDLYRDNVEMSDQYTFLCFHSYPYLLHLIPTLFLFFFHRPYIILHFVRCFYYLYKIHHAKRMWLTVTQLFNNDSNLCDDVNC